MNKKTMGMVCSCCQRESLTPSYIKFAGSYGSKYDMETVTLPLCAECFDRIYQGVVELSGEEHIKEETMK